MPTQKNGRMYCDKCGSLMRFRRRTTDYACTQCPETVPLSSLTPTQPKTAAPHG